MKQFVRHRRFFSILLLFACLNLVGGAAFPQDIDVRTRVVYIVSFIRYIKWPPAQVAQRVRKVGIYGADAELLRELQDAARQPQQDYQLVVRQINDLADATDLHLLYLPASKTSRDIRKDNESLGNSPVLIFAEREGTIRDGAAISLFEMEAGNRMTFEYNEAELTRRHLKADPQLLSKGLRAK